MTTKREIVRRVAHERISFHMWIEKRMYKILQCPRTSMEEAYYPPF